MNFKTYLQFGTITVSTIDVKKNCNLKRGWIFICKYNELSGCVDNIQRLPVPDHQTNAVVHIQHLYPLRTVTTVHNYPGGAGEQWHWLLLSFMSHIASIVSPSPNFASDSGSCLVSKTVHVSQ